MGQALTYEIGLVNIGRLVKVLGHRSNRHGVPGVLRIAEPKFAHVELQGHGRPERVEWPSVVDWVSRNADPLIIPHEKVIPKAPTLKEIRSPTMTPTVVAVPSPPPAGPKTPIDELQEATKAMEKVLINFKTAQAIVAECQKQLSIAEEDRDREATAYGELSRRISKAVHDLDHEAGLN